MERGERGRGWRVARGAGGWNNGHGRKHEVWWEGQRRKGKGREGQGKRGAGESGLRERGWDEEAESGAGGSLRMDAPRA